MLALAATRKSALDTDTDPAPLVDTPAKQFGPFVLLRELGRGGMGVVYEARDTALDRLVALKVVSTTGTMSGKTVRRLIGEARAAAKLEHPNVVTVYQVGEDSGTPYIAMQLIRGESVADRLARGPMSLEEVDRILAQTATGLAAAHAAGITHRDVKPHNILLAEDGAVKLVDFGLSTIENRLASTTDAWAGTPQFMSPEQARGFPTDGRSDLYSLAATWYCMLAGRPPFDSPNRFEVLLAHAEAPPPDVREFRPEVSEGVAKLIHRLMAKEPGDRPASVPDFLAEWAALRPVSNGGSHRRRWYALGGTLASLAVAAALTYALAGGTERVSASGDDPPSAGIATTADTVPPATHPRVTSEPPPEHTEVAPFPRFADPTVAVVPTAPSDSLPTHASMGNSAAGLNPKLPAPAGPASAGKPSPADRVIIPVPVRPIVLPVPVPARVVPLPKAPVHPAKVPHPHR